MICNRTSIVHDYANEKWESSLNVSERVPLKCGLTMKRDRFWIEPRRWTNKEKQMNWSGKKRHVALLLRSIHANNVETAWVCSKYGRVEALDTALSGNNIFYANALRGNWTRSRVEEYFTSLFYVRLIVNLNLYTYIYHSVMWYTRIDDVIKFLVVYFLCRYLPEIMT